MKTLGDRMKEYEGVSNLTLTRRTPVVIRIDGCHFHSFTRKFDKPFDFIFRESMRTTTERLLRDIQGCVIGYTQSDEISLVLCDYRSLDTDAWFSNRVQKICSVAASKATKYFNKEFSAMVSVWLQEEENSSMKEELSEKYAKSAEVGAEFDARCFNMPKEEVCNYLIWRQQDAERNSILSLAQTIYSQSELSGIGCKELQNKMFTEKGVNWNDINPWNKRGYYTDGTKVYIETPIFTRDRELIDKIVENGGVFNESDN